MSDSFREQVSEFAVLLDENNRDDDNDRSNCNSSSSSRVEIRCGDQSDVNIDYAENDVRELARSRLRCLYANEPQLQERILTSFRIIDTAFRQYGCVLLFVLFLRLLLIKRRRLRAVKIRLRSASMAARIATCCCICYISIQ